MFNIMPPNDNLCLRKIKLSIEYDSIDYTYLLMIATFIIQQYKKQQIKNGQKTSAEIVIYLNNADLLYIPKTLCMYAV